MQGLLESEVVIPQEYFSAHPFDGTEEDTRALFDELCSRMGIQRSKVDLEIAADEEMSGSAGQYQLRQDRAVVRVAQSQLENAEGVAATLIHELSHQRLLGEGILSPEEEDHEYVTDLFAVYLGLGIFAANSVVRETQISTGTWHSWSIGKQGYLTARDYGYAMALYAWVREELKPGWRTHLRPDARVSLEQGLKYLQRTQDSLFDLTGPRTFGRLSEPEVLERLHGQYGGGRVAALWEIGERKLQSHDTILSLIEALGDRNPVIREDAAITLGRIGPPAGDAAPRLLEALEDRRPEVRAQAARALSLIQASAEAVVPPVTELLRDEDRNVVAHALFSLSRYGRHAEPALPLFLRALTSALVDCRFDMSELAMAAITAATDDPRRVLKEHYSKQDQDLCRLALDALARADATPLSSEPT